MVKNIRLLLSVILLAALPSLGWAEDATAILDTAAKALGAQSLKSLQYSAAGSIYDDKGQHIVVNFYSRQMDLNALTSNSQMVLMQGTPPVSQTVNQTITSSSPWAVQLDFWLTPYGFLKGAMANEATAETKAVDGDRYKVVSFTLPGNHKVVGYINGENMVERVEVRTESDVLIQEFYHDYETFSGLKVPTVIVQRRDGDLSQVLIVKDAKPNA